MDDIGSAVKNFDEMIPTLSKIFESVRKSGLKLSPNKCEIGTQRLKLLGNIITPAGLLEIGLYEKNFRQLSTKDNSDIVEPQNFVRLSGTTIAASGYPDPADLFQDLNLKHEILNLENKQEKDPDIEDVKKRIRTEQVPNLTYENSRKKKYAKQFNRL